MLVIMYVATAYYKSGEGLYTYDMSVEYETYEEAISFLVECSGANDYDHGAVKKIYKKGEAQQAHKERS